jgi:hypothetical protein
MCRQQSPPAEIIEFDVRSPADEPRRSAILPLCAIVESPES